MSVLKETKFEKIFSGENSRVMWNEINAITDGTTFDALYSIGCKCQELESVVVELKKELDELRDCKSHDAKDNN